MVCAGAVGKRVGGDRTFLIPSSSLQLLIPPEAVERALARLYDHLQPGGMLAASFMTLWREGDPLETEWEKSVERADGTIIRRVARTRYEPATECEHTEDLYQVIVEGKVVAEEQHRRSPATRSYTQAQALALFARAGFEVVTLYSEFTFQPTKPEDTLFSVVARKSAS